MMISSAGFSAACARASLVRKPRRPSRGSAMAPAAAAAPIRKERREMSNLVFMGRLRQYVRKPAALGTAAQVYAQRRRAFASPAVSVSATLTQASTSLASGERDQKRVAQSMHCVAELLASGAAP